MLFAPEFPAGPAPRGRLRRVVATAALTATAAVGAGMLAASSAGAAGTVWDAVAACESGGNWAINTGNGYYGGLQFWPATWTGFGGSAYALTADKATKDQQILIAQRVLKVQGPGAWPTCGVRAGLTLANGLATTASTTTASVTPTTTSPSTPAPAPTATATNVATPTAQSVPATASPTPAAVAQASRGSARPLVVDGQIGPLTRGAVEQWTGSLVDGWWSTSDVKRLQSKVGATPDGIIGPLTTGSVQHVVGAPVTGQWGWSTTASLQRFLNKVLFGR